MWILENYPVISSICVNNLQLHKSHGYLGHHYSEIINVVDHTNIFPGCGVSIWLSHFIISPICIDYHFLWLLQSRVPRKWCTWMCFILVSQCLDILSKEVFIFWRVVKGESHDLHTMKSMGLDIWCRVFISLWLIPEEINATWVGRRCGTLFFF